MNATTDTAWPVLRRYVGAQLRRIAMPLGGIGTGTVSLGGRGDLRDWEIVNRPAKGFTPRQAFFALHARPDGGDSVTRLLEGPLDSSLYEGARGSAAPNHSLPRFSACTFETAYPFGQVVLTDPAVPLAVRLQAFNPLIPGDADRSGVPMAVLRFVLTNDSGSPVEAAICGSLQNFIGSDGSAGAPKGNRNTVRETAEVRGLFLSSDGVDPDAEQWGTLALVALGGERVSYRTAWVEGNWGAGLLDFWDDFSADGALTEGTVGGEAPVGSLVASVNVPPGETRTLTFLLAWHFPNRRTWTPSTPPSPTDRIGNYYATQYADAWDVAVRTAGALSSLETETLSFVQAFYDSDLPDVVKEAALFNLSTLRTQTCFRTADGRIYGWEGCDDRSGCCHGSCTHVWNYEQATAFLFGDLARSMREVEFLHTTRDDGHMSFRVNLPLERAQDWGLAAADGQLGCLMKLYREWQLSGDEAWLRRLWPAARRALEFCWRPGGWDADRDGVMEGCQHNTMDVEYYGPNPQMGTWYLGALRAMEELARRLGEEEFADECRRLFANGSAWLDMHLFNGEYYEHEIRPVTDPAAILPGLRHEAMGARDPRDPELQLGAGCLVDQLVGQYMACVCGLGALLDPAHIDATLSSLMKYNFKQTMLGQFNPMRSYALGPEAAMLMATYPRGRRPRRPFPYFAEAMTGFEYTVAVHLLYEGRAAEGLRVIQAIRNRYDGEKRSPFDEAECGHHYARAMASWGAVLALTGFHYSADDHLLRFAAAERPAQHFWSNGDAWGICRQQPSADGINAELAVLHGSLIVRRFQLDGFGAVETTKPADDRRGIRGHILDPPECSRWVREREHRMQKGTPHLSLSRRGALRLLGGALAAVPLAACGGTATGTTGIGTASTGSVGSSSTAITSTSGEVGNTTTAGSAATSTVSATAASTSATKAAATTPAGAETKLVFLSRGSVQYQDVFKQSITNFQQLHPDIGVENQPVTGNFDEKLATLLAGNVAPDTFFGMAATFLVYPIEGATITLDSYAAKGVDFRTSDYYPYWLKTMQWRGKLVALPYDPGMVVLYYNKTLFDKAGLPYPDAKAALTWGKLLTIAEQLTVDNKGNRGTALDPSQVVQYGIDAYSARMWWHLPREHGIDIYNSDLSKTTLDQQAAIDGLQTLVDLNAKYHVVPSGGTGNGPAINFQSDNLAMAITGGWQIGLYREQVKSVWDIAPLPQVAGKPPVGMGWASGLMITKQSKQADAGWQFLTYLAGKQGQQLLLKVGVSQPMLISMANDPAFTASAEPAHRDALLNEVTAGDPPPYIPAYMEIQTAVQSDLLNPTLSGKENLQTALATVIPKINAILAKYKQQYGE